MPIDMKAAICRSASELLTKKRTKKLTVKDIVEECGITRQTFYYHFQDIPTLMIDSIEDWMADVIQKYGTLESPADCLTYMAQECMKRKKAFLHLFRSVQKDIFLSRLNEMGYDIIRTYVNRIEEYEQISKEEKEVLIKSYKCIFVGSLLDWLVLVVSHHHQ